MTAEQIDGVEAGRETDALVAEWLPLEGVVMEAAPGEGGERRPYWRHDAAGFRERFQPTTDPEAAAAIVDWLETAAGCTVRVGPGGLCRVTRGDRRIRISAPAPELAVCKAALLVMLSIATGAARTASPTAATSSPPAVPDAAATEGTPSSAAPVSGPVIDRPPHERPGTRHPDPSSYAGFALLSGPAARSWN